MDLPHIIYKKTPSLTFISLNRPEIRNGLRSDLRVHLDYVSSQLALLTQTEERWKAVRDFVEKEKGL